jgi:hypothetical protein
VLVPLSPTGNECQSGYCVNATSRRLLLHRTSLIFPVASPGHFWSVQSSDFGTIPRINWQNFHLDSPPVLDYADRAFTLSTGTQPAGYIWCDPITSTHWVRDARLAAKKRPISFGRNLVSAWLQLGCNRK